MRMKDRLLLQRRPQLGGRYREADERPDRGLLQLGQLRRADI